MRVFILRIFFILFWSIAWPLVMVYEAGQELKRAANWWWSTQKINWHDLKREWPR